MIITIMMKLTKLLTALFFNCVLKKSKLNRQHPFSCILLFFRIHQIAQKKLAFMFFEKAEALFFEFQSSNKIKFNRLTKHLVSRWAAATQITWIGAVSRQYQVASVNH